MQGIFAAINSVFGFIGPLSDFLWDFPTNMEWYRNIPILGNISLAIILLSNLDLFRLLILKRESGFLLRDVL